MPKEVEELQRRAFGERWHLATQIGGPALCPARGEVTSTALPHEIQTGAVSIHHLCSNCTRIWGGGK